MKLLSAAMLAVVLNFSLYAMDDYAQAWLNLKKQLLTYNLEFQVFVEHVGMKYNWGTLEDHTAVKLRALSKPLRTVIVAHRAQKIKAYEAWILSHCQSFDNARSIPVLVIEQGNIWYFKPKCKFINFHRKIKINLKQNDPLIRTQQWHLEPHSLVIGPSGNRLQGEMYYSEQLTGEPTKYILAVQFPLQEDGSIAVSGLKPMQHFDEKINIYDKDFNSLYRHDTNYTRFCCPESPWETNEQKRHIIVGGSGRQYVHTDYFSGPATYDVQFHNDEISVFVHDGAHGFKKEHPYHKVSIEYRFTEGGKRCDHYMHMVAPLLSQPKSRLLSLANVEFLPDLQNYLKICPTTVTDTPESTPLFAHPVRVVTHRYIITEEWSLELFERVMKGVNKLANPDNDKHFDTLSKQWSRSRVSSFVQAALLAGANGCYYEILGRYCRMRRCETATLWRDYSGKLCYKKSDTSTPVSLPNPIGPVPALPPYIKEYPILHDWVAHITKEPVTLENSLQYLRNHKKDALKLTPAELITLFETRAQQHAQKTWDDGTVGALWEFDTDGMRINVYDLQKQDDHLVGTYLAQGYTAGIVTRVEYTPDTQPIIYIDGQQVDI